MSRYGGTGAGPVQTLGKRVGPKMKIRIFSNNDVEGRVEERVIEDVRYVEVVNPDRLYIEHALGEDEVNVWELIRPEVELEWEPTDEITPPANVEDYR